MPRRAKIVCTVGPASCDKKMLKRLIDSGMNVARLNFSHGTHESHKVVIDALKELREKNSTCTGIMLDTKGPEIRIGEMPDLPVAPKKVVRFVGGEAKDKSHVPIIPESIIKDVKVGSQVLIADGHLRGYVVEKGDGWVDVEMEDQGVIEQGKGINIPMQTFDLPDMTDQDMLDIEFGCKQGVDFIAASFINTAAQLLAIKEFIRKCGGSEIKLIAKIETRLGVQNFDDILTVADGIMVARGDLGVELPVSHVPTLQKKMIKECNLKSKPVIVATQMLESMVKNPTPTRAEASDVANAVYDSCTALMLSAETAVGSFPAAAVRMMHEIIVAAEKDFDHRRYFDLFREIDFHDIQSAMARAAVNTGFHVGAGAILVCSNSGLTIQNISRYRPKAMIVAITPKEKTYFQTSLLWGTECYREKKCSIESDLHNISAFALQMDWVSYGDPLVVTLGKPFGVSFTTNTITVESVGNVIVRGQPMERDDIVPIAAPIQFFLSQDPNRCQDFSGKIVVMNKFEKNLGKCLKSAAAVILENHPYDVLSEENLEEFYKESRVPFIIRADGASTLLEEEMKVRVYPSQGFIVPADSPTENEYLNHVFE